MTRYRSLIGSTMFGLLLLAGCADDASHPLAIAPGLLSTDEITESEPQATSYSGRATVVSGTALGIAVTPLADTGPLPESGGAEEASLLTLAIPDLLTAELGHATTVGQGDGSHAEASVANLTLTVGGNTITARVLRAEATAVCNADGTASVSGESEVVGLVINGQEISVGTQPNQVVELPLGGRVIINEQTDRSGGTKGDLTVTALRVIIPGVPGVTGDTDLAISSAHADIQCEGWHACLEVGDFVTGGGWIEPAMSGDEGHFAVAGGIKTHGLWGHLVYQDRRAQLRVKGTEITAYAGSANTREIEGKAEINGTPGYFWVEVTDNGEPGRGSDTFHIRLSNGYTADGILDGGNIQLHGNPCK